MKCNNCGTKLSENDEFCPNCGVKIDVKKDNKTFTILVILLIVIIIFTPFLGDIVLKYKDSMSPSTYNFLSKASIYIPVFSIPLLAYIIYKYPNKKLSIVTKKSYNKFVIFSFIFITVIILFVIYYLFLLFSAFSNW
jgi:hypothetical protein